jgi:ABC-type Fe3+-hydroxamate transport system substrate-binding protein
MAVSMNRRILFAGAGAGLLLAAAGCNRHGEGGAGGGLTDLRDRPLSITPPVGKLSIDDGRYLIALSLIHPDPVSVLAAWSGDVNRISPEMYRAFVEKNAALATLPKTPSSAADFDVEAVLAAGPDVAVVSLGSGPTDAQVTQLEAAGVNVAFIDFFTHPFENQSKSLSLLGKFIGREEQAEAYNAFRAARLKVISDKVAGLTDDQKPTVFLEAHAGNSPDCCNSVGQGNVGDYITFVGGRGPDHGLGQAEPRVRHRPQSGRLHRHRRPSPRKGGRLRGRAPIRPDPLAREPAQGRLTSRHRQSGRCRRRSDPRPVAPADQFPDRHRRHRGDGEVDPPRTVR